MNMTNPYYTEHPFLAGVPVTIAAILSIISGVLVLFLKAIASPPKLARFLSYSNAFHIFMAILIDILLAKFCFPLVQRPYVALRYIGLFSDWGMSTLVQSMILLCVLMSNFSSVVAIFYYRMEVLLPRDHYLNNKLIRAIVYTFNYPILNLISIPALYFAYEDQKSSKLMLFEQYHVVYDDFFTDKVIVIRLDDNNWGPFICGCMYVFVLIYVMTILIFSFWNIYNMIRQHNNRMSEITKKDHMSVIKALLGLFICFLFLFSAMVVPSLCILFIPNWRSDLWVVANFNGAAVVPIIFCFLIVAYRPYRRFIVGFFVKTKFKFMLVKK